MSRKGNQIVVPEAREALERFKMAYAKDFNRAVQEIRSGERQSRWTAEIFPPLFRSVLPVLLQKKSVWTNIIQRFCLRIRQDSWKMKKQRAER